MSAEILRDLDNELTQYYRQTKMLSLNPVKAEYLISRGLRQAAWSAFGHIVYTELNHRLLPLILRNEPILPEELPPSDIYFYPGSVIQRPYSPGQYDTWIRAGAYWVLGTSKAVLNELEANPQHPYNPLLDSLAAAQERHRLAAKVWNGQQLAENVKLLWDEGMIANLSEALTILDDRRRAHTDHTSEEPSTNELLRLTLADMHILNQLTSVNKKVFADLLAPFSSFVSDDQEGEPIPDPPYGNRKNSLEEIGPEDSPSCRYMHSSLKDGPWPIPRFCAGRIPLKSPNTEEQAEVREFFSTLSIHTSNETFDTATYLLVLMAKLRHNVTTQSPEKMELNH